MFLYGLEFMATMDSGVFSSPCLTIGRDIKFREAVTIVGSRKPPFWLAILGQ